MKKILFAAYNLDIGGIEIALLNLLNNLVCDYDITLILEKKQGTFLSELDSRVRLLEYCPNSNKNIIIRKFSNLMKRIRFILKYRNQFDFAASFAAHSQMASFCSRIGSKNNALWIHSNYLSLYSNDKNKAMEFFKFIKYNKFKNIICVSNDARQSLKSMFNVIDNVYVINNLIDYNKIIEKSKEPCDFVKINIPTFLNVSRHEEQAKKLSRLIYVAEKLKNENLAFRILLIGNGPDTDSYIKLVKEKSLENEVVFLGAKYNPYPYFNISNAIVLTSDYEGYPVVFNEARVLNVPIITTNVSDAKSDISGKFGIVTNKNIDSIYEALKQFIYKNYKIENQFNPQEFNNLILTNLKNIFNGGSDA